MKDESGKFFGRAYLIDDEVHELCIWDHDLEPMDARRRPVSEWARESLCASGGLLRELLELPKEGNYQAVFEGTIYGWKCGYSDEYDEEINISSCKYERIPEEFLQVFLGDQQRSDDVPDTSGPDGRT